MLFARQVNTVMEQTQLAPLATALRATIVRLAHVLMTNSLLNLAITLLRAQLLK